MPGPHIVLTITLALVQLPALASAHDSLTIWMTPEIPSREALTGEFALTVPRRHQQHKPIDFTSFYALKLLCNEPMMARRAIPRKCILSKRDQTRLCRSARE
jgi:hypothetical protein